MIVELIAQTVVTGWEHMREAGWEQHVDTDDDHWSIDANDADQLAEFAGRLCYQSWSRPNPKTATNEGYLAHIVEVGHFSIMEHASATFYVAGVSRSLSHELVRHRHLSFSQLSQRFVDEGNVEFIVPPALQDERQKVARNLFAAALAGQHDFYTKIVEYLMRSGLPRKQAREAARAVLPNATETRFVVTGNMRAWRDVLSRRLDPAADAEIRLLAMRILAELMKIAPGCFRDINARLAVGDLSSEATQ